MRRSAYTRPGARITTVSAVSVPAVALPPVDDKVKVPPAEPSRTATSFCASSVKSRLALTRSIATSPCGALSMPSSAASSVPIRRLPRRACAITLPWVLVSVSAVRWRPASSSTSCCAVAVPITMSRPVVARMAPPVLASVVACRSRPASSAMSAPAVARFTPMSCAATMPMRAPAVVASV